MYTDGSPQEIFPRLKSLTLSHLEVLFDCEARLLAFLKERLELYGGLRKLIFRSCLVNNLELKFILEQMVPEVKWDNVEPVGSGYSGPGDYSHMDEPEDDSDDDEIGGYRETFG